MNEPPFCKSDTAVICEFIVLFSPAIKLELELILLKVVVIVEFPLLIKNVFDEISLIFVLIKLVFEDMLSTCVVDVAFKLLIQFVFDKILLNHVSEVSVRLPIKHVFDETLTKLLAMVAVLLHHVMISFIVINVFNKLITSN